MVKYEGVMNAGAAKLIIELELELAQFKDKTMKTLVSCELLGDYIEVDNQQLLKHLERLVRENSHQKFMLIISDEIMLQEG